VRAASDFAWQSQIRFILLTTLQYQIINWKICRFYYGKEKSLEGRLMFSSYQYGWEFLLGPFLVLIPSTLRCFRALVAAHQMGTFFNLQGAACCGKSATFSSLAALFGKFRVAVTCTPSTNEFTLLRVSTMNRNLSFSFKT